MKYLSILIAALFWILPAQAQTSYPPGSIPITASATRTTGAIAATIPAVPGKTAYLCGLYYTGTNATAANTTTAVTVTGIVGGTMSFGFPTLAAGATVPNTIPVDEAFLPCVPATSVNTAITVNGPALGAGATQSSATAWAITNRDRTSRRHWLNHASPERQRAHVGARDAHKGRP